MAERVISYQSLAEESSFFMDKRLIYLLDKLFSDMTDSIWCPSNFWKGARTIVCPQMFRGNIQIIQTTIKL